jgi:hypothetical protein
VADPTSGPGALRLTSTSSGTSYIASGFTVSASTNYALGMDIRRQAGSGTGGGLFIVDEFNGVGGTTRTTLATVSGVAPGASWQRITAVLTTRSDTASLAIYWVGLWTSGDTFDVFGMQLEQRATATARIVTAGSTVTRTQSISIPIAPALRTSPNANEPLVLAAPPAVWMLASDDSPIDLLPGLRGDVALTFEEAIY